MTVNRVLLVAAAALVCCAAYGGPIGPLDTFQNGTTNNWFAGGLGTGQLPPTPPAVVLTGGPAGAGDAYLVITANGGGGPGSKLVAINADQWAGDYLASQVAAISMDLRNLGNTSLTIRLLFEDPMGAPPNDEAVTNFGVTLPAGGNWVHARFPISPSQLTAIAGDTSLALSQATILRIIHAPTAGDAQPVVGVLGVDNIAAEVPEPSALLLMASGIVGLALRRLRRT